MNELAAGHPRLLVIEDDARERRGLRLQLGRRRFEVADAADATSAIAIAEARSDELDVCLVDLTLPDRSGQELMAELREVAPFTQCIVVTGAGDGAAGMARHDAGAWDYFVKPVVDWLRLERAIEQATRYSRSQRALAAATRTLALPEHLLGLSYADFRIHAARFTDRVYIEHLLATHEGDLTRASRQAGVSRVALRSLARHLAVTPTTPAPSAEKGPDAVNRQDR